MKTISDLRSELAEVEEKRAALFVERGNYSEHPEHLERINSGVRNYDDRKREIEAEIGRKSVELEQVREAAKDPRNCEAGDGAGSHNRRVNRDASPTGQARDEALRAIERVDLEAPAKDRLEGIVRRDQSGIDARYVAAHSDPDYAEAFAKVISGRSQYELTEPESRALRAGLESSRAMSVGVASAGGYGVPIQIDPTIVLTNDGQINPLRQLATVRTITTSEWRGVSSAGVTAAFVAEGTEVADGTPTLAQPVIVPERAQAFVPYSIETGMDYPGLQSELGRLLADAKDVLEAEQFVTGRGHTTYNEPQGIITGTTGTVAAGSASFAVADLYEIQEALAPRFSPRASWLSSLALKNASYRKVAEADATEPKLWNDAGTHLLGKPWSEVSDFPTAQTNGNTIFIYGDVGAGFEIVDRIGLTVELVPHLFGASGRPTGQRGLFAYWRTSSGVVNTSALKALVTTAN